MDYIIYRQNGNEFMRFNGEFNSRGQIVVMGDRSEANEEMKAEKDTDSNPLLFTLKYTFLKTVCKVEVRNSKKEVIGKFSYPFKSREDDINSNFYKFYIALDKWSDEYVKKMQ